MRTFRRSRWLFYVMSLCVLGSAAWFPVTIMAQVLPGSPFQGSGSGGGASFPVSDEVFKVCDDGDATKCVEDELAGVTTGNTIVRTWGGTAAAPIWTFTGGTILYGNGDVAAPALAFAADADGSGTGLFRVSSNFIGVAVNGAADIGIASGQVRFGSGESVCFGSNASGVLGGSDTCWTRESAAVFQSGLDVNGAAVNQTIKAHDGITGTDIAGAGLTIAGGRGTGSGAPGDYKIQTSTPLASGTTAQTLTDRAWFEGGLKTLTDTVATAVFTVTTGNDVSCGGTMFFCVEAADAANQQSTCGEVHFAAADNAAGAGGEACGGAVTGTNATAATSGTLTVTATVTDGGTDVCNVNLTATGSLTETVGPRVRYSVLLNPTSSGTCAITPQ